MDTPFTTMEAARILHAAGCRLAVTLIDPAEPGGCRRQIYTVSGPIGLGDLSGDSDDPTVLARIDVPHAREIDATVLANLILRALAVFQILRARHTTGDLNRTDLRRAEQEERRDRDSLIQQQRQRAQGA